MPFAVSAVVHRVAAVVRDEVVALTIDQVVLVMPTVSEYDLAGREGSSSQPFTLQPRAAALN
jgi:hypothetical protein